MGDDPNQCGNSRRWIITRGREQPAAAAAPTGSTSTRSTAPSPTPTSTRRSARSATSCAPGKVRYIGSLDVPRRRRSSRRSGRPSAAAASASSASSRRTRSSSRGIEDDVLPTCQRYGMGVIPWSPLAGGWLTGRYRKGARRAAVAPRRAASRTRYDLSLPGNQRKLEAADALAELADEAGHDADRAGARVRARAPGGDRGDHRPAHDGAARVPARRRRRRARPTTCSTASTRSCRPGINVNPADGGWQNPALDAGAAAALGLTLTALSQRPRVAVSVRRGKRVVARAARAPCPPAGACCACARPAAATGALHGQGGGDRRVVATRHVRVRRARR